MTRAEAKAAGEKFYDGRPCHKCGGVCRYTSGYLCMKCAKEQAGAWAKQNANKIKAADKTRHDRTLYNLLPDERAKLAAAQGGLDPITGAPLSPRANVDHCHKTGLIRGLLNPLTNKQLVDNISVLRATISYLESPPAIAALGETVYGLIGQAKRKKKMLYGPDGSPAPQERSRGAAGAVSSTADALT